MTAPRTSLAPPLMYWIDAAALDRIRLADGPALPPVTHGVCPRCLHELAALAESPDASLSIDLPPPSPD